MAAVLHPPQHLISLAAAAAIAYNELTPGTEEKYRSTQLDEVLDAVAAGLSTQVRIYGLRSTARKWTAIPREQIARGRFSGGAMLFQPASGVLPITHLMIRRDELELAIDNLRTQALSARDLSAARIINSKPPR